MAPAERKCNLKPIVGDRKSPFMIKTDEELLIYHKYLKYTSCKELSYIYDLGVMFVIVLKLFDAL